MITKKKEADRLTNFGRTVHPKIALFLCKAIIENIHKNWFNM